MDDKELLFLKGGSIPLRGSKLLLEQPTLNVVAMLGERNFFEAMKFCQVHRIDYLEQVKDAAPEKYHEVYNLGELDTFFLIAQSTPALLQQLEIGMNILFSNYEVVIGENYVIIGGEFLTNEMYEEIKEITATSIGLNRSSSKKEEFNVKDDRAKEIVDKIKQGREKLAQEKRGNGESASSSSIANFISALAVGLQIPITSLFEYTLYQLYDQIKRFGRKQSADTALKAMLAGAKDVKTIDWFSSSEDE